MVVRRFNSDLATHHVGQKMNNGLKINMTFSILILGETDYIGNLRFRFLVLDNATKGVVKNYHCDMGSA